MCYENFMVWIYYMNKWMALIGLVVYYFIMQLCVCACVDIVIMVSNRAMIFIRRDTLMYRIFPNSWLLVTALE